MNMVLWVRQSSPNFARVRQSSHEGALMLPVYPGICLSKGTNADQKVPLLRIKFWPPHPQPQKSLLRTFRLQPSLEGKFFLIKENLVGAKLLHCKFPGLSLLSKKIRFP